MLDQFVFAILVFINKKEEKYISRIFFWRRQLPEELKEISVCGSCESVDFFVPVHETVSPTPAQHL